MPAMFEIDVDGLIVPLIASCENYYVLSPGDLLRLHAWPAWCTTCRRFTEAERFETVDWYDDRIRKASHYADFPGLIPPDDHALVLLTRQLPDLRRRRVWRRHRVSPPKCIQCGTTRVDLLSESPDSVDVPGVGRVRFRIRGRCSSEGRNYHLGHFTPEGDRLTQP